MNDHDKANDDEKSLTGTMERLQRDIERLADAYGGDYSEVLEAYRQAEQAANRRAKRLERRFLQAKHEAQIANYELRIAKDIIDDIQRGR
jgi:FKBP-type peptidyl-prolyl cis-trans isomerase (trigger factor)